MRKTFSDVLPSWPVKDIMVRFEYPQTMNPELTEEELRDGILLGFCDWDGEKLIPYDDSEYRPDWELSRYELSEYGLVVWLPWRDRKT